MRLCDLSRSSRKGAFNKSSAFPESDWQLNRMGSKHQHPNHFKWDCTATTSPPPPLPRPESSQVCLSSSRTEHGDCQSAVCASEIHFTGRFGRCCRCIVSGTNPLCGQEKWKQITRSQSAEYRLELAHRPVAGCHSDLFAKRLTWQITWH